MKVNKMSLERCAKELQQMEAKKQQMSKRYLQILARYESLGQR
jgi:hypothetical protein